MPNSLSNISVQLRHPGWKTRLRPYCKTVRAACEAALGKKHREMTVVLANDAFIRELNKTYRGKDKPTNVLAFPSGEKTHLGDLILALETIEREAKEQKKTFKDHAAHLLVHDTSASIGL